MTQSTTQFELTSTTTSYSDNQPLLIIVVSIGGVIITASIIIIIVVAVFVRKSSRELRQQTRSDHNRPHGPRPAHANSVRMAQGQQRIEVIRSQPEAQEAPRDLEMENRAQEEIQGYYAVIPRSEDLGTISDELEESKGKVIVYASLDFDNEVETPGEPSEETGSLRLIGPSIVLPSSQLDTYVEMEPLVFAVNNDAAPVQSYPDVHALANDPELEVQRESPGGQISTGVDYTLAVGDPNCEVVGHDVNHPLQ